MSPERSRVMRERAVWGLRPRITVVASDTPQLDVQAEPASSPLLEGLNPQQRAAMYSDGSGAGVPNGKQLQGKELSFNNIVDLQAAWDLAQEFEETACAIIKHTNPSGCSTGKTLVEAYMLPP